MPTQRCNKTLETYVSLYQVRKTRVNSITSTYHVTYVDLPYTHVGLSVPDRLKQPASGVSSYSVQPRLPRALLLWLLQLTVTGDALTRRPCIAQSALAHWASKVAVNHCWL